MRKLLLLAFFGMLWSWTNVQAQGTITTFPPLTNNNGSSGITFEVESTTPVNITDIKNLFYSGTGAVEVWYRVGGVQHIAGSSPDVTVANGWVQHWTGTASGDNVTLTSIPNWTDLSIAGNQRVGIAIFGNLSSNYQSWTSTSQDVFTDGTFTVYTGQNIGYGGSPTWPNHPRQFLGSVSYELGIIGNCTPFSNFTIDSTSATATRVAWSPGASNNSYFLEYGPSGFTPGNGTKLTGTVSGTYQSVVLTGLNPQTSYDVYFGEICNNGADSAYFPTAQPFTTTKLCASPTNFSSSNVTPYTVDLSWNQAGTITEYYVIHGPSGFDPMTAGTTDTATASPYTLSGLVPASTQDIYLATNCGGGNGISDTVGPITITTACATIATFPWLENFENATISSGFPQCWADSSAGINWQVNSGTTSSSNTGPSVDHTTDSTIGKYVYIETSSSGGPAFLETPYFDFSGLTNPVLSFWYHAYGATVNKMEVEVSTDSGATWTLVYRLEGEQQASSAAPWQQASVDLGQFKVPHTKIRFVGYTGSSFTGDIAIDDVEMKEGPACPVPSTFVTGVTDSSASFNIIGGGNSYQLEWGPTGFVQGTGCATTTSNGVVTIDNSSDPNCAGSFAGNTTYDLYIRRDCGNGVFSTYVGPITFTTACSPFTAPYSQNFDNTVEPNIDPCWTGVNLSNGTSYVESYDFVNNSAPNSIDMYSGSATDGFVALVSPQFSDLDSAKRVSFYYYDDDNGSDLYIGTVASPTDSASFMPLDTLTAGQMPDDTWTLYILDLTNYTGTNKYVAIRHGLNGTFDNIRIDDFDYSQTPTCNPPLITSLMTGAITSSSAVISWGANSDGDETQISWGAPGFTAGAGIGIDSVSGSVDQYNITGLGANTDYEVYIRDSCANDGYSPWIGPLAFSTSCLPVSAPYLEDFDGNTWVAAGSNAGNSNDPCWSSDPDTDQGSEPFKWIPRGTGPTSGNGPLNDLTGGNFMYAEASSSSAGDTAVLTTPLIDLSSLNAPALYFWQHRYNSNASIADMYVDVSNDNGATWTNVYSITGTVQSASSDPWEDVFVNMPAYVNDTVQIRFMQVGNGCCGDAAIDSVAIDEAPACPDPGNLQAINVVDSGATIDWIASSSATNHEIWFGPAGFFQGTTTVGGTRVFTGSGNGSFVLDTLTDNSCYEVLVRGVCQPGDTTAWVGPITFCTPCVPTSMPYYESFDTWPPSCWNVSLGDEDWVSYSGIGGDNYAEASFWSFNDATMIMQSATVQVTQDAEVSFEWSHSYNSTYPDDSMQVKASVAGSGVWETIFSLSGPSFDDPAAGNTSPGNFIKEIINLDPATYTGEQVVVQVIGYSDWGPDLYINNFRINKITTCFQPDSIMVSNVTQTSADLSWVTGGANNWQIEYGPAGFTPGTGTLIGVSTNPYTLTGLNSGTFYDVYLRDSCGPGDVSLPAGPVSFSTNCSLTPVTLPFTQDFETMVGTFNGSASLCDSTLNIIDFTSTDPEGRLRFQAGPGYYNGNSSAAATLDKDPSGTVTVNYLDLKFDMTNYIGSGGGVSMDFYYMHHGEESHPNDSVWIRGNDSANWIGVYDLYANQGSGGTYNFVQALPIGAVLSANGQSFSSTFQIRFGQEDNFPSTSTTVSDGYTFDDIMLYNISCPAPTNLTASNINDSSAAFSWSNPGSGSSFELSYGPNLNDPALGTIVPVSNSTSYGVTTLTPGTNYCVYVREICGVGDTSFWEGPVCFSTPCPAAYVAPYHADFEGIALGSGTTFDNCWTSNTTSGLHWEAEDSEGSNENSSNTGPFYDATTPGVAGGTYMYLETSSSGDSSELYSPYIDISSLQGATLEYAYHMYGADINKLEVYAEDQNGSRTFLDSLVGQQQTAGSDSFAVRTVALTNVSFTTMRVVFVGYYGGGFSGDIAIDEVHVQGGCPMPMNLNTSSVACDSITVTWTGAPNAVVQYGPSGFTPGTGTLMTGLQGSATITGLTPGTSYDIWVAQACAGGDTSAYTGPLTVTSATGPMPVADISLVGDTIMGNTKTFDLDASGSTDAASYSWDFGNGTATGVTTQAVYDQSENGAQTIVLTVTNGCGTDTDTLVVGVDISVEENMLSRNLSMFPNPATTAVNLKLTQVESEMVSIKLSDLSGKLIYNRSLEADNGNVETNLSVEHLAKGMYMIEISDGEHTAVRRLIKR